MKKLGAIHQEAQDEIQRLRQNLENRGLADYRGHELRGQIICEADAREEGSKQSKKEIVRNMFKQNLSVEDIAKITGTNVQNVKEIIKSID